MAQQQHIERSPSSSSSEDDENAELFTAVHSTLDREQLPLLANAILRRQPLYRTTNAKPSVGEPLYGSYHILFPLTFDIGLRWIAKIPINGTASKWDELSASALISEANTMRLLKRETTIPLPDVLDYSSTTQNTLRCPYIIMTLISGIPLYNVWFGHRLKGACPDTADTTHLRRVRALESIASAMVQLDRFSFRTGGRLLFRNDGNPSHIGSMRRVDHKAMLDRWFVHKDPDDDPIYIEYAASSDPKAYYTFMLDIHPERNKVPRGLVMLLRQLISWISEPSSMDPFVLAHPDLDIQNFIVSEEGELRGVIDWDGIAAMPRTLGNERYPGWLTCDWDPAMYGYKESMEHGVEPEGVWEDSPESLAYYRGIYDDIMARHRMERRGSEANLCRMSLITENLAIAVDDPRCRSAILRKMVQEIWAVAEGGGQQLDFTDLADMFAESNVDVVVMESLHRAFNTLLSKKGL
ncbi:hypothetical protein N7489_005216 [Penicillium chrysogenum]|jgi:hypothetical protein|uniref:Aminoglycoside phosphotransferase domain-containing protein n=1 Tax=Penicillium chrysogenum TaxID=5076 RepID=A0ABQ8WPW3_PENCH|nr:uncharacterized protein N7489_005216 [Penicillium chrysogenum]KAJ5245120.1 hypothetical protein N7489_005216 [Penicillium chrysogenum]KAJ5274783.1 hypothetical protein N7505_003328 [Penicillium chrysogenum]KAJ6156503.1 hypothetical protein N7497_005388 [Penicillium chrysogenum]